MPSGTKCRTSGLIYSNYVNEGAPSALMHLKKQHKKQGNKLCVCLEPWGFLAGKVEERRLSAHKTPRKVREKHWYRGLPGIKELLRSRKEELVLPGTSPQAGGVPGSKTGITWLERVGAS